MDFCDASAFVILLDCFRPTPLLLSSAFPSLTNVCSLAHVAGKSQHNGDTSEVPSAGGLLAAEPAHPPALPWHGSQGAAGTLRVLAACASGGIGENRNFCSRSDVRDRAQSHRAIAVLRPVFPSFYSLNSYTFGRGQ